MTQMIRKPRRITKPDSITKTYNLTTLLSVSIYQSHYGNQHTMKNYPNISFIPKKDLALVEKELKETRWSDISCEQASDDLMIACKKYCV